MYLKQKLYSEKKIQCHTRAPQKYDYSAERVQYSLKLYLFLSKYDDLGYTPF